MFLFITKYIFTLHNKILIKLMQPYSLSINKQVVIK